MGGSKVDKNEAFVDRIRAEAHAGAEYFTSHPHHAGSTKTALALTRMAYECGERDANGTYGMQVIIPRTDLSWAKRELSRKIEEDEEIKKLRIDLRWAKYQVAKKEELMDKELEKLRVELDVALQELGQKKGAEHTESNITAAHNYNIRRLSKELEDSQNEKNKYQKLFEETSFQNMSNSRFSSDEFKTKVETLEKIIDAVEVQIQEQYNQMQSQVAQAKATTEEMTEKNEALRDQLAIEKAKLKDQATQTASDEEKTEGLKKEHTRDLAGYKMAIVNLDKINRGMKNEMKGHQHRAKVLQRQLNTKAGDCEKATKKAVEADREVEKLKLLERASSQVIDGLMKQNKDMKEKHEHEQGGTEALEMKDAKIAELEQVLHAQKDEMLGLQGRIQFLIDEKELQREQYEQQLLFLSNGKGPGTSRGRTKTYTS